MAGLFVLLGASAIGAQQCGGRSTEGPDGIETWARCEGSGTCTIAGRGCCGVCGEARLDDVDAVNEDPAMVEAHRNATCSDPHPICPACPSMPSTNLVAVCTSGVCSKLDLRTDSLSDCDKDEDCMLRTAPCCEPCVAVPTDLVAIAKKNASAYVGRICKPSQACPACVPQYPPGYAARCSSSKHCSVSFVACPAEVPAHGAPCSESGLACEYGMDLRPGCRTHASCKDGRWEIGISGCPPLPGPGEQGCPADTSATGVCSQDGLLCDMKEGAVCVCGACLGPCSIEKRWWCAPAPATSGCPTYAPALGSACGADGTACIYGVCGTATSVGRKCTEGAWRDEPVSCPL
jgi:hypothetical protein